MYVVHVRHRGYRPVSSEPLDLTEGGTVEVRINLRPIAFQLDAVTVYGDDPYDGFMERRRDSLGFTMMDVDFEAYHMTQVAELMSRVPMKDKPTCYRAYLDGLPVRDHPPAAFTTYKGWEELIFGNLSLLTESVYGVEVYRTRSEAPKQYRYFLRPECGVILVWTKQAR